MICIEFELMRFYGQPVDHPHCVRIGVGARVASHAALTEAR